MQTENIGFEPINASLGSGRVASVKDLAAMNLENYQIIGRSLNPDAQLGGFRFR
jgi:hypothetical protein